MSKFSVAEFERMWRVVDQSISAHSILRDRYSRWERWYTLLILAFSIAATAGAFASEAANIHIGPVTGHIAIWLGVLTSGIFFLTLVDLTVDWRRQAWDHEDSARLLSELRLKMRSATVTDDETEVESEIDLRLAYKETMALTKPIPENKFLSMKARHHRKVAVSKLIDTHKGAPMLYLKLLAAVRGIRGKSDGNVPDSRSTVEQPPV